MMQQAVTQITPEQWVTILWFAAAVLVLESLDIVLPRGDSLGVSGAMNSAAIVLLGPAAALIAMLLGTAAAFIIRRREIRTSRPGVEAASIVAGFTAAAAASRFISGLPLASASVIYVATMAVGFSYLSVELIVVQLLLSRGSTRSTINMIRGNVSRQAPLLAAQLSTCLLTVLIFSAMGEWSLVLVAVLLLLIRQSYALLLDIRETYRTTVEVLVEAAEGGDGATRGHAERSALIARDVGAACGMRPSEIERLSYAALLHDVDRIGPATGRPSRVLEGVVALQDVVRILRIIEGQRVSPEATDRELLTAFVVALASDIDAVGHGDPTPSAVGALADTVPAPVKAKAVSAAVRLGFATPAVS